MLIARKHPLRAWQGACVEDSGAQSGKMQRVKFLKHNQQNMFRAYTLAALLASLLSSTGTAAAEQTVPVVNCATELDATVAMASNPDHESVTLSMRFEALEKRCPAFAQLAHNQGVLAARENRWPQAIMHFKRALDKDLRAADTHSHLQKIYEYRAAEAYAQALNTPLTAEPPDLHFQVSSTRNADVRQQFSEHDQLRDIATIEYELFARWQAQLSGKGINEHYIDGYNIEAIKIAQRKDLNRQWENTKHEITFTEKDAVVVLSDSLKARSLLLMRLVGTRWKIYQETEL